jgi:hypothetical protein
VARNDAALAVPSKATPSTKKAKWYQREKERRRVRVTSKRRVAAEMRATPRRVGSMLLHTANWLDLGQILTVEGCPRVGLSGKIPAEAVYTFERRG